jgi:cell division protein FtsL
MYMCICVYVCVYIVQSYTNTHVHMTQTRALTRVTCVSVFVCVCVCVCTRALMCTYAQTRQLGEGEELYVNDPDQFDVYFMRMNIRKLTKAERLTKVRRVTLGRHANYLSEGRLLEDATFEKRVVMM